MVLDSQILVLPHVVSSKIDGPSIAIRILEQLVERGEMDPSVPQQAIDKYRLHDVNAGTSGSTGGEN